MAIQDFALTEELPALQLEILTASSGYLKAGGVMVYSTCTLNPRENEDVVNSFLATHDNFELLPFTVGDFTSDSGMLTLTPVRHGTDGFFVAKIRRKI